MSSRTNSRKFERTGLGTSPGTLQYVGIPQEKFVTVKKIEYNASFQKQTILNKAKEAQPSADPNVITWINIDGIHDPEVIGEIGRIYQLHPLLLEDILNTLQKPKFDFYGENILFLVLKWLEYNPYTREVEPEHVSLVLGPNWLLSFQEERSRDIFEPIVKRIEASAGKTRRSGSDYLLYALTDLVVDQYISVEDCVEGNLERLEEELFQHAEQRHVEEIYTIKRQLSIIRKAVIPLRDISYTLSREAVHAEKPLVSDQTEPYLRDLHDHIYQVTETIEMYREQVTGLLELYNSTVSNRLNNVMKVLTIISVIFMPLTFVAGIYGMNFDFMPELHWKYGYPFALFIMAGMVVGMLLWFRQKKWI